MIYDAEVISDPALKVLTLKAFASLSLNLFSNTTSKLREAVSPLKSNAFGVKARADDGSCKAPLHIFPLGRHQSQCQTLHVLGDLKPLCRDKLLIVVDLDELCPATSVWWKKAHFKFKNSASAPGWKAVGILCIKPECFCTQLGSNLEMALQLFFIRGSRK